MKKTKIHTFWVLVAIMATGLAVVAACELAVCSASKGRVYADVDEIPHREVGLLLGTNPKGRRGGINMFYNYRIDAAVALYESGKVDRIIISGAKRGPDYDEPQSMREALVARGVPDSLLVLDGQGYHTIESIVRAKEVFGVDTLTIISQEFHNRRAVYLAKRNDMDAIAYNAANTTILRWRIIMFLRERASRVKAVFSIRHHNLLSVMPNRKEYKIIEERAERALLFAKQHNMNEHYALFVNYAIPSGTPRLFVWDFTKKKIVHSCYVMHGSGGGSTAKHPVFSNKPGSECSALGRFLVTKEHGVKIKRSFRLKGMDGDNKTAYNRGLMIHGSVFMDFHVWMRYIPLRRKSCQGCVTVTSRGMNYLWQLVNKEKAPLLLWSYYVE